MGRRKKKVAERRAEMPAFLFFVVDKLRWIVYHCLMNTSIRQSLFRYMDGQGPRVITGWELFGAMEARTGRKTYPGTLLSYLRDYCDVSGANLECVNPRESRYKFTPGHKISGALAD